MSQEDMKARIVIEGKTQHMSKEPLAWNDAYE